MQTKTNVYDRARNVVRDLVPLLSTIREQDKSLADQLKRAAQSVVLNIAEARGNDAGNARARFSTACGSAKEVRAALNVASDWGYIEAHTATHLEERLDEVCAITWCLGRKL
jgi:four helix bundle protein